MTWSYMPIEFNLGINFKTLHTKVLMQMVYNAVVRHSGRFLKHMAISEIDKGKIMVVKTEVITHDCDNYVNLAISPAS